MRAIYLWSACWSIEEIRDLIDLEHTIIIYDEEEYSVNSEYINSLRVKNRAFPTSSSVYHFKRREPRSYNGLCREQIIGKVINDFRLFQLYSRFKRFNLRGPFSFACMCNDAVDYALAFLNENKVTEILCSYTPHTFESFVFIKTLEICGVSIVRLSASPLPWLIYSLSGLENIRVDQFRAIGKLDKDAAVSRVKNYFKKLNTNYENAMPYYERKTSPSIKTLLSGITPSLIIKKIVKSVISEIVRKEFNRYAKDIITESFYGVFFLHSQPEANSMPEAGIYYDQFQAIKKLSDAMPPDMPLLIKEHPSTLSRKCDIRYRPPGFYARLCKIKNVKICPIDSSTFSLIDNSKFVASISGMSMTEALARSIPVISFNPVRFKNFPSNAVIDGYSVSLTSLSERLTELIQKTYSFPKNDVFWSFVNLESFGYVNAFDEHVVPNSLSDQRIMTLNANRKAILDFQSNHDF